VTALRTLSLLAATLSTGLGAGVFALYAHTIMPGLGATDDRTFVAAFQSIDRAVLNTWFIGGSFFGALVFGGLATALSVGRPELPWVAAAVALWGIAVVITIAVNVPLNNALKAAGPPDAITDLAAVRAAFGESRWRMWNLVRVAMTTVSFGLLAWALVVHGRAG
jgi:uncharacterized membrane protein